LIKRVPRRFDREHAIRFHRKVQQLFNCDRPQIVFDLSKTRYMDLKGADVLLQCLREAVKCDGDLKLAGLTPLVSIVLELTRVGQFFEIYDSTISAAKSFSSFLPNVGVYPRPHHNAAALTTMQAAVRGDSAEEVAIAA